MSEKISPDVLLPLAKDLYLQCVADKSPVERAHKAGKSREEVSDQVTADFARFAHLLEKRLTAKE